MTWASFIALLLLDGRPDWRLRHRADLSGCIELHGMASSDGGVSFSDQETVATAHVTCLLPSPEGWRFETWPQQGTVDRVKCEYKYEQGQRGEGVMVCTSRNASMRVRYPITRCSSQRLTRSGRHERVSDLLAPDRGPGAWAKLVSMPIRTGQEGKGSAMHSDDSMHRVVPLRSPCDFVGGNVAGVQGPGDPRAI